MNFRHKPDDNPPRTRPHNERLILDLVRRNGELSKAEIARASNLSAQSATVIVNRLVEEGMLSACDSVRGKVGQPSTPYRLNPLGAASVGIKVGRRSAEVVTMAFDFSIIEHRSIKYDFPNPENLVDQLADVANDLIQVLAPSQAAAIQGVGLAMPAALWSWETVIGAPTGAMAGWKQTQLRECLEEKLGYSVQEMNDANAACLASLRLGAGKQFSSFLYLYVGTFIGGGISFDHEVFEGMTGNAGAIASISTQLSQGPKGGQLLDKASLHTLENAIRKAGFSVDILYEGSLPSKADAIYSQWQEKAADALALASVSGMAFLDPEGIVLDTSVSPELRTRLVEAVNKALSNYDTRGLRKNTVTACDVGVHARSLGSALLPFRAELS